MARLFKLKQYFKVNWKYVIGEILLIFVGINLAIWFNNWNAANKSRQDKEVIVSKIKEEIQNNTKELSFAKKQNTATLNAHIEFTKIYDGNSSFVIATPSQLSKLNNNYPNYFRVTDSVQIKNDTFRYSGGTFIELELPEITDIAWSTARSLSVSNEFDYECMYELESMYNLQKRVQNEVDKAADALQKREMKNLINILEFLDQLDSQLLKSYKNVLDNIEMCK